MTAPFALDAQAQAKSGFRECSSVSKPDTSLGNRELR